MKHGNSLSWLLVAVVCAGVAGCTLDSWLWPFGNYYNFKNGVTSVNTDLINFLSRLPAGATTRTGDGTTTGTDGTTTTQVPTISENFTDADLAGWTVYSGNWVVSNGEIQARGPALEGYYIMTIGEAGWTDYQVSVDIRLDAGAEYALGVRYQNQQTWYHCSHTVGGMASISKFVTGSPTVQLGVGSSTPLAPGEFYNFRVLVQGNTITFFAEGERVVSVTDTSSPLTSGMVALLAPPDSIVSFDNVSISPLGAH